MRFLHVADLHGGVQTHSRSDPETGLPSRLLDVARCWHRAAEIACEAGVDVVILAGDTFHTPNPDAASLTLFAGTNGFVLSHIGTDPTTSGQCPACRDGRGAQPPGQPHGLRLLQDAGIPTLIIDGNHDRAPHANRVSVLEVFASDAVRVVHGPEVVEVGGGIRIACLPSVSRHMLMARRPGVTRSQADEMLVEGLVSILGDLRAQGADVLTAHWPVQGAILGNEKDLAIVGEPVIPLAELEGWRYVALGHIHKAQPIGGAPGIGGDAPSFARAPLGWYAGSVDRMNFGEEHERKVALVVDIEEARPVEVTQRELPARRFVTVDDVAAEDDGFDVEGAIVRLRLSADHVNHVEAIRAALYEAGADVVIGGAEVRREVHTRAEHVTESLGPAEALEPWFDVKGVEEADRPDLRQAAKGLAEEAT